MKLLLTTLYTLFSIYLSAQTGRITGRIVDESGLALAGATVVVDDTYGTISDIDGYYDISGLPAGDHQIEVSFIGYETVTSPITIEDRKTTILNVNLMPGVELAEVVVTSQLRGQARALNSQLSNSNITNVIAADQIGRFPDANIGDALKRIPGINVQYDQGEARFGNIRGTAPQLNSVTINGQRIPSAEAEERTIQLDLIPSDMIQTVEVNKAITPDMDADAIGGSVNLVTRSAPAAQRISGTLGTGYNLVAEKPSWNGSLIWGDRFGEDKFGVIFSASIFDNNLGSDNVEAEWTYDDANDNDKYDAGEKQWAEEVQIRQYYLQRIRQSYSMSLDYKFNPSHTIFLKGIYNQRSDWENRYRAVYKDIEEDGGQWVGEVERQTKAGTKGNKYGRLEDQEMMNFSLSGNHLLGRAKLTWQANYSEASEDRPNERYWEYASDDVVPLKVDFSNPEKPKVSAAESQFANPSASWELNELTEEHQFTNDVDNNGRIDLQLPISKSTNKNYLKVGVSTRSKSKKRDNDFYEYEPVDGNDVLSQSLSQLADLSKDNYLAGDYRIGSFVSREFVGGLALDGSGFEKEQDLSELAGNFSANESVLGGYAMVNYNFTPKLQMIAGLRVERTDVKYSGFTYDDDEETLTATAEAKNDYTNVLPGLHLKYNVAPRTVLRAAYTNALARPNYFDLVPYRQIEDGEELSIGNPDLKATTSTNFDVMAEHYFGTVGVLSGGVFYKKINDFIINQSFEDYTFEGKEWADFTQPINGGNADLLGFEMAFQRQLDFISPSLSGVGIYFNYTYTTSEVTDFNFEGRENDEISLPGSPAHTLNASLSYEGKKFTSRLSLNYASDFIDEVDEEAFKDVYYDAVTYLDFNFNYSVNDRFTVYLNANNLLNQPLRYFQGNSSRTFQSEYYNARFDLGLKFDFVGK